MTATDSNGMQDGVLQNFDFALTGLHSLGSGITGMLAGFAATRQTELEMTILAVGTSLVSLGYGAMMAVATIRLLTERRKPK